MFNKFYFLWFDGNMWILETIKIWRYEMKRLNTTVMRRLLEKGIKKAKRLPKIKSPDYCYRLFAHDLKNGWHYQIDKMYGEIVFVYAFKPPRTYSAKSAEYYLSEAIT